MRYILLIKNQVRAEAEFVIDLCHILAAYSGDSGDSCLKLENEFFERGYIKRGDMWISHI